ncbi:MAG: NUDIX domain-containing protein [Candidatus Aenigmarchaeota archaeon]|nr:NUDIX domain-containing protein [Candidatus Aenigmarchaeota archaeon]
MKPVKNAVAYVIYNSDRSKLLSIQRPGDDEDLPNAWGLPAGSLKGGETEEEAVLRSGKEKLGVRLKVAKKIKSGDLERKEYILHLTDYEAKIIEGTPRVPQNVPGVTQYQRWKWALPEILKEAARKGSLCCRLYLESIGEKW